MRTRRLWTSILLTLPLLGLAGCVILKGQRITMHYDAGMDRLSFLVHYDGIHTSESEPDEDSLKKLSEFAASGHSMLFDWFGQFDWKSIREEAAKEDTPPRRRAFLRTLGENVQTRTLGHYRDPQGRLGVLQEVVIDQASQVLEFANGAISEAFLLAGERDDVSPRFRYSFERVSEAARQNVSWIQIEGHSLVVRFPYEHSELAGHFPELIRSAFESWVELRAEENPKPESLHEEWFSRVLSSLPISIAQTTNDITFRLGTIETPSTLRIQLRDSYHDRLASKVIELAESNVNREFVASLLDPKSVNESPLPSWVPPETVVGALLDELSHSKVHRTAVRGFLTEFALRWNEDRRFPQAPTNAPSLEQEEIAWRHWYRLMTREVVPSD